MNQRRKRVNANLGYERKPKLVKLSDAFFLK